VIQNIQRNNPKAPMAAIGYSAGGHLLMRYVSSYGDAVPLSCAITVSGCFDFVKAIECVTNNENPSYKIFLDVQERRVIRRHVEHAGHTPDINEKIEQAMRTKDGIELYVLCVCVCVFGSLVPTNSSPPTLSPTPTHRYDEVMHIIRPDMKLESRDRYSLKGRMKNVKIASLILHALDDPVVNNDHIDWSAIASNPHMISMHTNRGGHVAFFDGIIPFGPTFSDRACANFISSVIESQSQTNFLVNAVRKSLNDDPDTSRAIVEPAKMSRIASFATIPSNVVQLSMMAKKNGLGTSSYSSISDAGFTSVEDD